MSLKKSKYNIVTKRNDCVLLYNTISGALISLDYKKYEAFDSESFDSLSKDDLNNLIRMGFITSYNEFDMLEKYRNKKLQNDDSNDWNIVILTTSNCNARCFYCYEKNITKKTLNKETADNILNFIYKNINGRKLKISWFGGEPLVNKNIIDYICLNLQKNNIDYRSTMISNGYLFKYCSIEQIKSWNLTNVQITLDSIGEEYNVIKNYVYENTNPFDTVINNIRFLNDNSIFVTIRINFDPRNLDYPKKILKYIHDNLKNKHLKVYLANIVEKDVPSPIECEINPYIELYKIMIEYGFIEKLEELKLRQKLYDCSIYKDSFVIFNPDGKMFKCEHALVDDKYSYNNINNYGLDNENKNYWEKFEYSFEECKNCVCLPICESGCKYYSLTEGKRNTCIQIKNCLPEIIELYYDMVQRK